MVRSDTLSIAATSRIVSFMRKSLPKPWDIYEPSKSRHSAGPCQEFLNICQYCTILRYRSHNQLRICRRERQSLPFKQAGEPDPWGQASPSGVPSGIHGAILLLGGLARWSSRLYWPQHARSGRLRSPSGLGLVWCDRLQGRCFRFLRWAHRRLQLHSCHDDFVS